MLTSTRTGPVPGAGDRAGMTLLELLIATLVFGTIMAGTLGFLATQNRAFNRGSDRMTILQNLRYAMNTLETNLETLGTNLVTDQPGMVLAGEDVVTFNADYATNIRNDVSAVFRELGATDNEVLALSSAMDLPNSTGYSYGDTAYSQDGVRAPAETLTLYFASDTATSREDDWVLYRKINDLESEVVARNLLQVADSPFFRYFSHRSRPSAPATIDPVHDSVLPLPHYELRSDSIRAVRVTLAATNGQTGEPERTVQMSRMIRMPNAMLEQQKVCGDEPIFGQSVDASLTTTGSGDPAIDVTWDAATDETGGEGDVVRYVVWRRETGGDWGAPFLSIPAGQNTYVYQDADVEVGTTYEYRVAAQDCTPNQSDGSESGTVSVPNP